MKYVLLLLISCMVSAFTSANDFKLNIYTEQYPPYNYVEDGEPKGIAYDLVVAILVDLQREDLIDTIAFVPWARGYLYAQRLPNTLLFSTIRSEEREDMFQWVGPIFTSPNVLIGKKTLMSDRSEPWSVEELSRMSFGAIKDDIGERIVQQHPVFRNSKKEVVGYPQQAAQMLESNRIDVWSYGLEAAMRLLAEQGFDTNNYTVVYQFEESEDLYLTFSLQTPETLVSDFQRSLDKLKVVDPDTGTSFFETLLLKYGLTSLN